MAWYPEAKPVPDSFDTDDLHLEMLAPEHVDMDYDALMSSRERLMAWSGGRWPHEGFTRDENMEDMIMHRDEFLAREAFAYTVLNKSGDRCEGCIYIDPMARPGDENLSDAAADLPESTALVTWWVRDDALDRGLDQQLIAGLVEWFRSEWQFDAVLFQARIENEHDTALLESRGLEFFDSVSDAPRDGRLQLYRLS